MVRFKDTAVIIPKEECFTTIVLVYSKTIPRISAKPKQNYLTENLIILSNDNGNRMVRFPINAEIMPDHSGEWYKE